MQYSTLKLIACIPAGDLIEYVPNYQFAEGPYDNPRLHVVPEKFRWKSTREEFETLSELISEKIQRLPLDTDIEWYNSFRSADYRINGSYVGITLESGSGVDSYVRYVRELEPLMFKAHNAMVTLKDVFGTTARCRLLFISTTSPCDVCEASDD